MHVMCRMRRRIHACHVSYEEEDTCEVFQASRSIWSMSRRVPRCAAVSCAASACACRLALKAPVFLCFFSPKFPENTLIRGGVYLCSCGRD